MRARASQPRLKSFQFAAAMALLAMGLQIAWVAILSAHERWEADAQHATAGLTAADSSGHSAPSGAPHHDHSVCHVCQVLAQVRIGTIVAVFLLLVTLGIVPAVAFAAPSVKPYIAPILSCAAAPRAPPIA